MTESTDTSQKSAVDASSDEGLLLYHHPASFFSRKVVFALHEKKLKFRSEHVSLADGRHLQPWFIKLNPKAQIPVLKDGVKVIPESDRIIDYLEDNFSNGDTPRLKPEKGSPQYQTMQRFCDAFDKVSMGILTFGCVSHPELTENMKMSSKEITMRKNFLSQIASVIDDLNGKHKELKDVYAAKKEMYSKLRSDVDNVDNVKKVIKELGSVFDNVEKELGTHEGDKEKCWLCGEKFTIADITLGIILNRVYALGLWNHYFGDGKLPKLNNYFKRIQLRDGYRRTVHQTSIVGRLCCMGTKEKLAVSLSTAVIVLGVAGLVLFVARRNK